MIYHLKRIGATDKSDFDSKGMHYLGHFEADVASTHDDHFFGEGFHQEDIITIHAQVMALEGNLFLTRTPTSNQNVFSFQNFLSSIYLNLGLI